MSTPIYLDYAATTPVDPVVARAMGECLTMAGVFANAASRSHIYGWQAEEKVETARAQVASLLNCDPREVIWTSGATESDNLALKGVFQPHNYRGHLITSVIEHKAIVDSARWLEQQGVEVSWLIPNEFGCIEPEQLAGALRPDTRLVSLMLVNNEVGSVNPIAQYRRICAAHGDVLLHVDAAQAAGRIPIDVDSLQVDLLSLSAHKFYGPKGIGVLYTRRKIQRQLAPLIHGGGHEMGLRSGTLATHQIVGMGKAAELLLQNPTEAREIAAKRDQLWQGIADLPGVTRNGDVQTVSPSHLNVCFAGLEGEKLLLSLRELAISSGSACTSASIEPSYVLKAMGLSDSDAASSLRISLGRFTSNADVERAIHHIRQVVGQLQAA